MFAINSAGSLIALGSSSGTCPGVATLFKPPVGIHCRNLGFSLTHSSSSSPKGAAWPSSCLAIELLTLFEGTLIESMKPANIFEYALDDA